MTITINAEALLALTSVTGLVVGITTLAYASAAGLAGATAALACAGFIWGRSTGNPLRKAGFRTSAAISLALLGISLITRAAFPETLWTGSATTTVTRTDLLMAASIPATLALAWRERPGPHAAAWTAAVILTTPFMMHWETDLTPAAASLRETAWGTILLIIILHAGAAVLARAFRTGPINQISPKTLAWCLGVDAGAMAATAATLRD